MKTVATTAVLLVLLGGKASALTITYEAEARDVYNRPTADIDFTVTCQSKSFDPACPSGTKDPSCLYCPPETYALRTDATGKAARTINACRRTPADEVVLCTFERRWDAERIFRFNDGNGLQTLTTIPKTTKSALASGSITVRHTNDVGQASYKNVPRIDYTYPLGNQGRLDLFLSGNYDKVVIVADGLDVMNSRSSYGLWEQAPLFMELFLRGVDVWVFHPADGAGSLRYAVTYPYKIPSQIDSAAQAIYKAMTHGGGNTRIAAILGISTGGVSMRGALALWEHLRAGGSVPAGWGFDFAATAKAVPPNVASFISLDSPQRGVNVVSKDLMLLIRRAIEMKKASDICTPKNKFRFMGGLVGSVIGMIFGPVGVAVGNMAGFIAPDIIASQIDKSIDLPDIERALNAGAVKEMMNVWCGTKDPASCTSTTHDSFYAQLASLNGNGGWPKTTVRNVALANGSWKAQNCEHPDQWGDGTCRGCGYSLKDGVYMCSTAGSSPSHIHTHAIGEVHAVFKPDPSQCSNSFPVTVAAKDVKPGSMRDIIGAYLGHPSSEYELSNYFATMFNPTESALDMISSAASTHFDDVAWPDKAKDHEDLGHPAARDLIMGYVYEFTFGDGDGFPTCQTLYSVIPGASGKPVKGTSVVGKLCGCDSNDTDRNIHPTCNTQSGGARKVCFPKSEICGNGIDEDCNGSDLACPTAYCGDGICGPNENSTTCRADCYGGGGGDGPPQPI